MDSDLTLDFIIIIVLIIANGLFSMTELAIVNAKKRRLEEMAEAGNERAKKAFELSESPNEMFSTIQIGITLVGILTGLYSGATFSGPLEELLKNSIPAIADYAASISSFIIVAIITYLSLVIGELVPKRLALNSPESIAVIVAKPIYWLSVALKPIVSFLGISTEFLLKVLGVTVKEEAPVTESEINKMLTEGVAMGAYEEEEPILVENIFHLADMNAGDIMTPRTQLKWIDLNGTDDEIMEVLKNANQYRIPVGTDSLDELKGLVTVSDVLVQIMQRPNDSISIHDIIKSCLKEPLLVPESITLMKLLKLLRTEGVHETIVLDEYGGFSGLVTLHDIMEEIVGLMPSGEEEIKEEENRIIEREDGTWLIDGLLDVDEFKEFFHIDTELPGEEKDLYKTMGGLLNVLFGRIPKELDKVKWNGYTFEVIDMDNTRIDKILVTYEEPVVEQTEE
ncbi:MULTISPECIES: hemolysin family protein [Veillonella]|uniref:hemolysin family protein n=1 Tax=Veillonella TaxID=29465 RepID=UPI0003E2086D|nr:MULTISPECIES: hemolysin family protein [Veillonella]ETS92045.1 membrane protein, PF01595 family [Veillonella sp. AS16]